MDVNVIITVIDTDIKLLTINTRIRNNRHHERNRKDTL